ncbi:anthranilate synthase component I [Egibacter rhizosphaerae]|uniref:Anthranilate synthase component 1 n=1 Tax=Egibacter rhizosphaerae TaxID=1670831 RepID=A0A411YKU3_9ACTN|nr:anthranilate synthase component I [Egibacter rhizosphaerae]QBI21803.1 anthranilate synthase component I [Egibacter rhizosphaerae]
MTTVARAGLYRPTREAFCELAGDYAIVPVWREVLADVATPVAVYERLRAAGGPSFLLESVEQGERWGRYSFIGRAPLLSLRAVHGSVSLQGPAPEDAREAAATGDPLATLEALLAGLPTPDLDGLPPLHCGAVGYVGWDTVRWIEHLPDAPVDDRHLDDVRLDIPGQLIAFDHLRQRLLVVSNVVTDGEPEAAYESAVAASEDLVARLAEPVGIPAVPPPEGVDVEEPHANVSREQFLAAVETAKEYIAAGDIFQVVPSQRFDLSTDVDPLAVYRVLRVINPSPYMYCFSWDDLQIVGSSPEALVRVTGRHAQIWPIAGSRPRGRDDREDAELASDLLADDKERAEHTMLVDLARNDLGRVCELGSVQVEEFMSLVRYSHVMHLHSEVTGDVREGVGPVDVLRATFPAGTLSGAPKVRAMEIIDELETTRRGPYGGGIGYFDLGGDLDLCITIRTVVFRGGRAYVQAGAGLVADSVPEAEHAECGAKARGVLAAIRAAERFSGPS